MARQKYGGGTRKARNDIAPEIRGAFMRACKSLEMRKNPTSLTELIEEALRKDVNATLTVMARWVPREMLIDATVSQSIIDVLADLGEADDHEVAQESGEVRH